MFKIPKNRPFFQIKKCCGFKNAVSFEKLKLDDFGDFMPWHSFHKWNHAYTYYFGSVSNNVIVVATV